MAPSTATPTRARTDWQTYRRLVSYARPYWLRLALGVLFGAIFGGSMAGLILGLGKVVGMVFGTDADLSWKARAAMAGLLPLFALARGVGDYFSTYFIEWVGQRAVRDLRVAAFAHLQDLALDYYQRTKTGDIISRVVNDSQVVQQAVSSVLADLAKQPFALVAVLAAMLWNNLQLAVVGLVLFPVCIVPVLYFGRRVRRFAREGQEKIADLVTILQEATTGVRIVKAFGMEPYEKQRFAERCHDVFHRAMKVTRARAAVEPIIVGLSAVGISLFLLYTMHQRITISEFVVFAAALVALYDPVKKLSRIHMHVQQSSASADRIFEVMDAPVTIRDRDAAAELAPPVGEVAFEDVSFSYDHEPVLRRINLKVKAGQRVAIVGGSGAGKTTLVCLIPRFFDVSSGRVLINGRDIREYTLRSLRAQIGIVTQETVLFNDTVARNIAYGKPSATREEIVEAARRANAHDFIMALPQGYDTPIGERGLLLSGGQCQRLAIARAILRNPPILILDEATSALDTESERLVQAALDELMKNRTVFAIAHRISTIINSDCIYVLDRGVIVEQGTHRELYERGGPYKRLYDLQFENTG
jgi:subfamily B ATP-binding cassette protein MsbA